MFSKVLIANRGEIAVRIARTLHEMGIGTVAVYSEVDENAPHVHAADQAVALGDPQPTASYLHIDKIIAAAKQSGAEAIHPGYGFVSENADFARAVAEAGLIFIGPPAEVIALLGNKVAARQLMVEHDVPVIPGLSLNGSDDPTLNDAAEKLGLPILVKAAAGGGGKGMRIVRQADELASAVAQAASEAAAAFGDGSVFLEKYLERPRHVEFQILADQAGHTVHLFERECSIQRRYQKIIEETPSPALDPALRQRMGEAAVAAARAANYVNAGTVEFMLTETGEFYFLEVNTRLQVEHPITEITLGLDLVRLQLQIAAGQPLILQQSQLEARGHAIECRVYAEDPAKQFMPAPGKVVFMQPAQGPGIRFDCGVRNGYEVPVQYDPILGKLIAWAEDRPAALARMTRALEENVILGVPTTTEFMLDAIRSEPFRQGRTHTGFIAEHFADWQPSDAGDQLAMIGYAVDQQRPFAQTAIPNATGGSAEIQTPWQTLGRWDLSS